MTRLSARVLAVLVCAAAVACRDQDVIADPEFVPSFDMERAAASTVPLREAFEQPMLVSFAGASNDFLHWFGVPPGAPLESTLPSGQSGALPLRTLVPPAEISASVIPDDAKGTTYVFDVLAGRYVADASATGAPPSGIRVVLYAWDAAIDRPVLPLQRIGFADLSEEASTATFDLLHVRIIADAGNLVVAEYDFSSNFGVGSSTLAIQGIVQDGSLSVGFSAQGVSSGPPLATSYVAFVSAPSLGVRVRTERTTDEFIAQREAHFLTYDGHTLLFDRNDAAGEVRYDNLPYASFVSTIQEDDRRTNEYVKVNGAPPTPQEQTGLESALAGMRIANSFWFPLIWPFR